MKKRVLALVLIGLLLSSTGGLFAGSKKTPARTSKQRIPANVLKPHTFETKYNEPADLLNLIPIIRDINQMIPRRFSLVNHDVRLAANEIIIQHHFLDQSTKRAPKNSIISLSYYGDLGRQFETQLDVPLFYSSSRIWISDWSRYPVGNYTMTITPNQYLENSLYLRARTRF